MEWIIVLAVIFGLPALVFRLDRDGVSIGRLAFGCYMIADWIGATVLTAIMRTTTGGLVTNLAFVAYVVLAVTGYRGITRRLRDLDQPALWVVLSFVPIINFLFFVYLLLWPGSPYAAQRVGSLPIVLPPLRSRPAPPSAPIPAKQTERITTVIRN